MVAHQEDSQKQGEELMKKRLSGIGILVLVFGLIGLGSGCSSGGGGNFVGIGKKLFSYYCADCHGNSGKGNGYNAEFLDTEPKDLTDSVEKEMVELTNEQIFASVSRDLKDQSDDAPAIVSQMPTFKYTLSEAEIWSIIAYVRTLHPNNAPKIELTKQMKRKRPRSARIRNVVIDPELMANKEKIEYGMELFEDIYGCTACHSREGEGGIIGPPLDRAGFMSNADWLYRWLKSPQAIDSHTKMPALGLTDEDAMAVVAYLKTLQAPAVVAATAKH